MTTLYLVTAGCYSDYRVLGVFSTKELAEKASDLYDADNPVDEIELDDLPDAPPGLLPWRVRICDGHTGVCRYSAAGFTTFSAYYNDRWNRGFIFRLWAKDEQHAAKIASEKRSEAIASGIDLSENSLIEGDW